MRNAAISLNKGSEPGNEVRGDAAHVSAAAERVKRHQPRRPFFRAVMNVEKCSGERCGVGSKAPRQGEAGTAVRYNNSAHNRRENNELIIEEEARAAIRRLKWPSASVEKYRQQ